MKETKSISKNIVRSNVLNLHVDHHFPLFLGNTLTIKNAVVLCESCNCSKGHKDPSEFYTPDQLKQLSENYKIGEDKWQ